jgi:hypothetical protein
MILVLQKYSNLMACMTERVSLQLSVSVWGVATVFTSSVGPLFSTTFHLLSARREQKATLAGEHEERKPETQSPFIESGSLDE